MQLHLLAAPLLLLAAAAVDEAPPEPTTREMNLMGWQEFAQQVPEQIETVETELAVAGFSEIERRFDLAKLPRVVGARWQAE